MFFLRLDSLPLGSQLIGISQASAAENMGVTPDHLGDNSFEHIVGSKLVLLGKHGDQHGKNKKNIADFFADFLFATVIDCFCQLLTFFQEILL